MNLQNTPWDYQEHDRIISILAWVVVVVLVIYASVFFYKQITTAPERPRDLTMVEGTQPLTATAPPILPPVESAEQPPVEQPPVRPPVVTAPVKPPIAPPVVATRPPVTHPPVKPPPQVTPVVTQPPPQVAPVKPPEPPPVTPPVAELPPVQPPPVTEPPRGERMTLKLGTFMSAGEAVRSGVGLGIDGHTFTPVRDPLTNRYTLHFGEFTGWKDAIVVMEKIRAKDASLDVVVWPLPTSGAPGRQEPRQPVAAQPAPEPERALRPVATVRPEPAPVRPQPRETPEAAETPRAGRHAGPTGPYVVRVASYKQIGNATGMVRSLLETGYRASMDETTVKGERWYRVHATGFDTLGEARDARQKIVSLSKSADSAVVVKVP
jgi:hypothetical protein